MSQHFTAHKHHSDASVWGQDLYDLYMPQASTVLDRRQDGGRSRQWSFDAAEVTNYERGPICCLREARHVEPRCEDHSFISIPALAGCAMNRAQDDRTARCPPGRMIAAICAAVGTRAPEGRRDYRARLRRGPTGTLSRHIRVPWRHPPAVDLAGALVSSPATSRVADAAGRAPDVGQAGELSHSGKAPGDGHLMRAERYIQHPFREDLAPAAIAAACGISVGYPNEVCGDGGRGVTKSIVGVRLLAADRMPCTVTSVPESISGSAFSGGFGDAAHFPRRLGASRCDFRGRKP